MHYHLYISVEITICENEKPVIMKCPPNSTIAVENVVGSNEKQECISNRLRQKCGGKTSCNITLDILHFERYERKPLNIDTTYTCKSK